MSNPSVPQSIIQLQVFQADPDFPVIFQVSELIFLMPIFRQIDADHYIDATGDYDLCMSADGKTYEFINRRPNSDIFAYRFIAINYISTRRIN